MNATCAECLQSPVQSFLEGLAYKNAYLPFYAVLRERQFQWISDKTLNLILPITAYWVVSLLFYVVDELDWVAKYRIHEPEEIKKRNKVTPWEVIKAVAVQHAIQFTMGYVILENDPYQSMQAHQHKMVRHAKVIYWVLRHLIGQRNTLQLLSLHGSQMVAVSYWWLFPTLQFFWSIFVLDTWQYFMHRYFHQNKWLYKNIHSIHHRLYCPYSFGALYNHPLEGFLFDTCGASFAQFAAGMTLRQATFLFTVCSIKTVDDHCGFALPWDPCQFLWQNHATYHDIHHQTFGLKYNFSQPYFIHWDTLLGTRLKPGERPKKAYTDERDPLVKEGKAVPVMPVPEKEKIQ